MMFKPRDYETAIRGFPAHKIISIITLTVIVALNYLVFTQGNRHMHKFPEIRSCVFKARLKPLVWK